MELEYIEIPFLKLGRSGKIRTGAGFNSSDFKSNGVPLIKIGNIQNNEINLDSCSYISENEKKINLTSENDLLIAMRGATSGKLGIVSKENSNTFYVGSIGNLGHINDELIYLPFIKYIEQQLYDILKTEAKGTATPMVSIGMLEKFKLIIPKTKEQQKYLFEQLENNKNQVGELSNELSHQLTLVKKLRQSFLQEAVQGKLVAQNPDDEPASELLKKIKAEKEKLIAEKKLKKEKALPPIQAEEIPFEIPEGWVWCRLGEICTIKGGKRVANGYKLLNVPTPYIYIRVSDMKNGTVDDSDLHYLDETMFQKIKQYTISKDDIYMTIVGGTIGKCGLIPEKFHNMNLTENAAKISPILINKVYLWKCLDSPFCQNQFIDKTKQVGVQKMALNRFSNSIIPLPPLSEQIRIVQKLDELMQTCDELEASIKESQAQNEKLLQQVLREALRR
jgi:restriction endonuclease S subunit